MTMTDMQKETVKDCHCHHPWTWMMVSADGSVKPCCWAPGNLGNLYQANAEDIWNGALAQELRQAVLDDNIHPICANSPCKYVQNTSSKIFTDASSSARNASLKKVIPIVSSEMKATASDVIAAYKLFLNRMPENEDVLNLRVGRNVENVLTEFLISPEFRKRHQLDQVILALAADILKRQQFKKEQLL